MVTKKKKRRSRAKKINLRAVLIGFALFAGSIIILTWGLYLSNSISTISPPAYEEVYSKTSYLSKEIGKVDQALYESLYRGKIPERNIFFLAVKPRHEDGNEWDFIEILVRLSNRNALLQFGKIINNELSPLRPDVRYKSEKRSIHEIDYHIFALGLYTHKIRLIYKGHRETLPGGLPRVGLIIDDLGYDRDLAVSFLQLDLPLSFSVLPLAPYTKAIVREAHKRGRELILHLPMEPKDYPSYNPGPGALLTDMDERDIRRTIADHLAQMRGARGVNNHMGSYFTIRKDKMAIVMGELKRRNLFYIDSRTTTQTVAYDLAKKMGVPVAKRNVFIDNHLSQKSIKFQMERLLGMARHSGVAIGIAHPHEETLQVLKSYLRRLRTDVKVVPVSDLVS
jgi:polysaccharide deacetylase 2 family uncharacterized protein YibQ